MPRSQRAAAGVCAFLAVGLAGCGSAVPSAQRSAPTTAAIAAPVLKTTLTLSGAVDLSYVYAVPRDGYRSCADVAALRPAAGDTPRDFGLPVPAGRPTVDGHPLTVAAVIALYHGAAHYTTSDVGDDDTLVALDDPTMAFMFGSTAHADGEVQPDGSGRMVFAHMENPAHQVLDATIAWTCTGPS